MGCNCTTCIISLAKRSQKDFPAVLSGEDYRERSQTLHRLPRTKQPMGGGRARRIKPKKHINHCALWRTPNRLSLGGPHAAHRFCRDSCKTFPKNTLRRCLSGELIHFFFFFSFFLLCLFQESHGSLFRSLLCSCDVFQTLIISLC